MESLRHRRSPEAQASALAGAGAAAASFRELYDAFAPSVARWALRLGGPAIDCEDVVQEVFLVVDRRLASFRGEARLSTWIFRITENTVNNHRRKARLRAWFTRLFHHSGGGEGGGAVPVLTPADVLERRQEREALYRKLERLPDNHRKVMILFELEGLSCEEVAALLAVKVGTVRVWLHRARAGFLELEKAEKGARR